MRIALIWFFISAILSIYITVQVLNAVVPKNFAFESVKVTTEENLLGYLLSHDTVTKEFLQDELMKRKREFKGSVINDQLNGLPAAIFGFLPIVLSIINILLVLGIWIFVRPKRSTL